METKSFNYENLSPTPQRRRLSVPETIMRKHYLAMERSNLQEFKNFNWDKEVECLSDPNLSRKKDFNLMRKSMLLRRLWGDSSKSRFSGSFQEWQHSCKKLSSTQSLNSNHSSPERKFKNAAASKKFNSSSNRSYEEQLYISNSPKRKVLSTPFSRESTTKYTYSTFTNATESNSDSAYSPSFTNSISSRCNNNHDENSNVRSCESSVQTRDVTNLNVISNVNLSQATLDVIFKEVMKDVRNLPTGDININTATVLNEENSVKIEKAPRFFIDANTELEKFIISKVRTGSPYLVSETQPTVPRFSAVPRTFSMEVNTSEEDKEEEESDTGSFVDSLEDFTSPRNFSNSQSSGVYQLLPEVNDKEAKSVSELLPVKVREKLNKRQQLREENSRVRRSSVPLTTSNINAIKSTLNSSSYLPKKRTKPVLPSIDFLKKSSSGENSARKSKAKTKEKGKKRIEILEIMECVDLSQKKSRIPLPVTKTEFDKPVYLDLDNHNSRDKDVDQLIANILIDTLNQDQESDLKNANVKDSNAKKNDNNEIKNNNLNPKSKSSIPKGWVTVYTMQKDLKTPESTSDEALFSCQNDSVIRT
ncbi:hypothetical protein ABEB36_010889 [Hypothenemus hampei]|uniref:Uncharacterized protein n=1 Tax=Hypothenemus hampei TaxID=57062 RepID=A0ABD1EG58_HYPHA